MVHLNRPLLTDKDVQDVGSDNFVSSFYGKKKTFENIEEWYW